MDHQQELHDAVNGLYEAFARRPLRDWTDPCLHCCATVEEEAALHAAPLRDLPVEVVRNYAAHAMTTWGDASDFAHFLPRIFEIVAMSDFNWPDIEVVFSALRRAEWRGWSADEQRAVERYLMAKWRSTLDASAPIQSAEEVLCAIGQAVDDLSAYLEVWERADGDNPTRQLVELILWSWRPIKNRLSNAFWDERNDQMHQVIGWLQSPAPIERLEDLATSPSDELSAEAALALQVVGGGSSAS